MEAIEERAGYLPPGTLHSESAFLVHDGTVLDNGMTLGDSGVTNESSISINFRGLGGVRRSKRLKVNPDDEDQHMNTHATSHAVSSSTNPARQHASKDDAYDIAFSRLPTHVHHDNPRTITQLYKYVDNHFDVGHHQLALDIILEVADKNPNEELTDAHFFQYAHNHPQAKKHKSYSVANENEKLPPQEPTPTKRTVKSKVSFDSKTEVKLSSDCVFSDDDQSECTSQRLSDETQSSMNVDTKQLAPGLRESLEEKVEPTKGQLNARGRQGMYVCEISVRMYHLYLIHLLLIPILSF